MGVTAEQKEFNGPQQRKEARVKERRHSRLWAFGGLHLRSRNASPRPLSLIRRVGASFSPGALETRAAREGTIKSAAHQISFKQQRAAVGSDGSVEVIKQLCSIDGLHFQRRCN